MSYLWQNKSGGGTGGFWSGPAGIQPKTFTDRTFNNLGRLTGLPSAHEAYMAGQGSLGILGAGAYGSVIGQPLRTSMALMGVHPLGAGNFSIANAVAFEKTGPLKNFYAKGTSLPYKYAGNVFTGVKGKAASQMGLVAGEKLSLKTGSKLIPVAGSLFAMYFGVHAARKGWKEGGAFGAVKEFGKEAAIWAGFDLALAAVGPFWPILATQGVSTVMTARNLQKDRAAYFKSLPLGTAGPMDAFNTRSAYTMRQRGLMQIQNSHLNARNALGHEATHLHISSMRMA